MNKSLSNEFIIYTPAHDFTFDPLSLDKIKFMSFYSYVNREYNATYMNQNDRTFADNPYIDENYVEDWLKRVNVIYNDSTLHIVLQDINIDTPGSKMNYPTFINYLNDRIAESAKITKEQSDIVFNIMDSDKDGIVNVNNITSFFLKIGLQIDPLYSTKFINKVSNSSTFDKNQLYNYIKNIENSRTS